MHKSQILLTHHIILFCFTFQNSDDEKSHNDSDSILTAVSSAVCKGKGKNVVTGKGKCKPIVHSHSYATTSHAEPSTSKTDQVIEEPSIDLTVSKLK